MAAVLRFLTRTREPGRLGWTDILAYSYLVLGVVLILAPVLWLFVSSFKSQRALIESDPRFLPYEQVMVTLPGSTRPVGLVEWKDKDGTTRILAQIRPSGTDVIVADPAKPGETFAVPRRETKPHERVHVRVENYTEPTLEGGRMGTFYFPRYFANSAVVTIVATLITLTISSMAAFALSKYRFRGRDTFMFLIVATLLMPATVILVPLFVVVKNFGMLDSLWGVIIPGAATPTGVFLLRQYMLTIPDELIEAARMDSASEWKIYYRIVLPLALPALAVLAILSIIWRWNDFLWPLVVLSHSENFTLQLGLSSFKGEMNDATHYLLAMTVLTLLPVSFVFAFLQKYITTGIANTGMK
ncbi:MAG: ABC transporter permease subunit [Alphaproteobacteria bacterium]|nr:ABC transporter permease subunit [Alphaproteobacteria bacterium]